MTDDNKRANIASELAEARRLLGARDLADYATGYRVAPERYQERRTICERLLGEIERVLRELGWA